MSATKRNVNIETDVKPKSSATVEMKKLARLTWLANKAKNKASGEEKKHRKELYKLMKGAALNAFRFTTTVDEKQQTLSSEVTAPVRSIVNMKKLKEQVDAETYDMIVSATKGNVEKFAGKAVAELVCDEKRGEENVTVKSPK